MAKKSPFRDEDLDRWRESFKYSPYRYEYCKHGHAVDRSGGRWNIVREKRNWQVVMTCRASCETCTRQHNSRSGSYTPSYEVGCVNVGFPVPDDPAQMTAPPYPRHESTQWRDGATVLPGLDGVYTAIASTSKPSLFGAKTFHYTSLFFMNSGEVLDFEFSHANDRGAFQWDRATVLKKFDAIGPGNWRGLFRVTGQELSCSLTEVAGQSYGYAGTIATDTAILRLTKHNAKNRKVASLEYSFQPFI